VAQQFAQPILRYLLIRALVAAIEPGLELADADRVLNLGLLDANGRARCGAESRVRESAPAELGKRECGGPRRNRLVIELALLSAPQSAADDRRREH
jgi:hypothetical protein